MGDVHRPGSISLCHFFPSIMQRFSCIIGPNGSGKSNIIDAMLFVFGYRAQKIRSKKLSVLIHNSDKHTDIQSCSVEVHFQKIIDKVCMLLFRTVETFFFFKDLKTFNIGYFRLSWGKLHSMTSLSLGCKTSIQS